MVSWRGQGMVSLVLTRYEQPEAEAVRNLELLEDDSQVGLDGSLGNVQPARDFLVAPTLTNQQGDLALPGR